MAEAVIARQTPRLDYEVDSIDDVSSSIVLFNFLIYTETDDDN